MSEDKDKGNRDDSSCALVPRNEGILDIEPGRARSNLLAIKAFQAVVREVLIEGADFGKIPGCGDQPTLLKPGAEKIAKLLNLYEEYEFVEKLEDWDKPLFHYLILCTLKDMASGTKVASGLGECNSRESRYRFRWVPESQASEEEKNTCRKKGGKQTFFEPVFALKAKETTGKYGKSIEYWNKFEAAVKDGRAKQVTRKTREDKDLPGYEIEVDTTLYQIPNPEIFDQVNTMVKIGKKRALVDAVISAARLGELFTQDLEDLTDEPIEKPSTPSKPSNGVNGASATQAPAPGKAPKTQAEYEAYKAKPLVQNKDEFTNPELQKPLPDDTEPEAAEPGPLSQAVRGPSEAPKAKVALGQLERFAKLKANLATLDVNEMVMWSGIHNFSEKTFKRQVTELSEFSPPELEAVLSYLGRWEKAQRTMKEASAARREKDSARIP